MDATSAVFSRPQAPTPAIDAGTRHRFPELRLQPSAQALRIDLIQASRGISGSCGEVVRIKCERG